MSIISVTLTKQCYSKLVNCLVTGTNGYLGKVVAQHLSECGYKVFEIGGRRDFEAKLAELASYDLDVVIHAGCTTEFVDQYQSEAESENIQNTHKLIKRLNTLQKNPYLILLGAAGIFGVSGKRQSLDETSSGSRDSYFRGYDQTQYIFDKKIQIRLLDSYSGISCTLCLTTVFGKSMSSKTLDVYRNIKNKTIFPVPPGGSSYLGEGDMLSALDVCLSKKPQGTFVVSSGNISFQDLFGAAKKAGNFKKPFLVLKIPFIFLFVFFFGKKVIQKLLPGMNFNILLSTFGYKYYSADKFYRTTSWKPKDRIESIFKEIL